MKLQNMLKVKLGWVEAKGPSHEVVLSSRVRVARNIRKNVFPQYAQAKASAAVLHRAERV